MNPRQKILFSQLQLAGLGIVIAVMAWVLEQPVLYPVGGGIFIFGLIRLLLLSRLTASEEDGTAAMELDDLDLEETEDEDEENSGFMGLF